MNTAKTLIAGLVLLKLFFPIGDIKADYIYLKNGSVISGVLVEEKAKLLIYRTVHGEMFINRENVSKIIHESKDKPLFREAEKYLKDRKFKRAIKTCREALEIKPDSVEALEVKQKAIDAWRRYEAVREKKVARQAEQRERKARELEKVKTALKDKWGIAIKKGKTGYIITDIYYNCPLPKGKIKPGDILTAIHNTNVAKFSIKNVYNLLLTLKKINLTIQRPVVLTREEILWRETIYVGLGISIEKIDKGIKITNLLPSGPARKAGLLRNDVIIKLGNRTISSSSMDEILKIFEGRAGIGVRAVIEREVTLE